MHKHGQSSITEILLRDGALHPFHLQIVQLIVGL